MVQILDKYPEWKQAYLKEDSQEAKDTFDYLLKLRDSQEKQGRGFFAIAIGCGTIYDKAVPVRHI